MILDILQWAFVKTEPVHKPVDQAKLERLVEENQTLRRQLEEQGKLIKLAIAELQAEEIKRNKLETILRFQ